MRCAYRANRRCWSSPRPVCSAIASRRARRGCRRRWRWPVSLAAWSLVLLFAFRDVNPQAPAHVLIVPKRHVATLNDLTAADDGLVGEMVRRAGLIARELGHADSGYRTVFNCNAAAGQTGEQQELLQAALQRIDPQLRAIFLLRELESQSYREIAQALAIPEGTVGSRLNRARRELKEHLAALGWEG